MVDVTRLAIERVAAGHLQAGLLDRFASYSYVGGFYRPTLLCMMPPSAKIVVAVR
jgi:hypothetical protein